MEQCVYGRTWCNGSYSASLCLPKSRFVAFVAPRRRMEKEEETPRMATIVASRHTLRSLDNQKSWRFFEGSRNVLVLFDIFNVPYCRKIENFLLATFYDFPLHCYSFKRLGVAKQVTILLQKQTILTGQVTGNISRLIISIHRLRR